MTGRIAAATTPFTCASRTTDRAVRCASYVTMLASHCPNFERPDYLMRAVRVVECLAR